MIAVHLQSAAGAPIHAVRQRELLPVATAATGLAGIGGVDLDHLTTSVCSFVRQIVGELPLNPRHLCFWRDNGYAPSR